MPTASLSPICGRQQKSDLLVAIPPLRPSRMGNAGVCFWRTILDLGQFAVWTILCRRERRLLGDFDRYTTHRQMLGGRGSGAKIWRRAAERLFGIVTMHATQCAGDFARANAIIASAVFLAGFCVVASLVYIFSNVGFVLSPGFIPLRFPSFDDIRYNGFVGFRPLRLVLVGHVEGIECPICQPSHSR